jgi:hypothetical protein
MDSTELIRSYVLYYLKVLYILTLYKGINQNVFKVFNVKLT